MSRDSESIPEEGRRLRLIGAGVLGFGLSAVTRVFQVPRGWWPLVPIAYMLSLLGLAATPELRRGHVVAAVIATVGGVAGVYSFGALALRGWLRDVPPAWVENSVVVLALAFLVLAASVLGLAILSWRRSPEGVPQGIAWAYVGLAAGCIATLEAGWLIRVDGV